MNITLLVTAITLFAVGYIAKRRFGLLGLALIAGSIISAQWSTYTTVLLQLQGVKLLSPPLNLVVAIALLVLPATFLLFAGPKYKKKWQLIAGSAMFCALGVFLVAVAIMRESPNVLADGQSGNIAIQLYPLVIVIGVVLAVVDTVMAHMPKKGKKSAD